VGQPPNERISATSRIQLLWSEIVSVHLDVLVGEFGVGRGAIFFQKKSAQSLRWCGSHTQQVRALDRSFRRLRVAAFLL